MLRFLGSGLSFLLFSPEAPVLQCSSATVDCVGPLQSIVFLSCLNLAGTDLIVVPQKEDASLEARDAAGLPSAPAAAFLNVLVVCCPLCFPTPALFSAALGPQ